MTSSCGRIRCWQCYPESVDVGEPLAGKSTLNRLELTPAGSPAAERYNKIAYSPEAIDELLVTLFLESHRKAPRSIVLDVDATDTPLHGKQEARFFHGYYNHYCYLPLYIFCGDQLLCARLRPSNIDAHRERRRTATHRRADSESLAAYADHPASGLRVLP
jgi:hypothetical protein